MAIETPLPEISSEQGAEALLQRMGRSLSDAAPPRTERLRGGLGREVEPGIFQRSCALPSLAMAIHIPRSGRDMRPAPIQHVPQSPQAAEKRHIDVIREFRLHGPLTGSVVDSVNHPNQPSVTSPVPLGW